MKAIDFRGFSFNGIHSSDLHLEVVSSSNRYEPRILPSVSDVATDIAGSDGQYLFGSTYKNREFSVSVAFDNVSEEIYRQIRQLFSIDTPQDLIFDEEPYKVWKAKIKGKPEFKSLCFTDRDSGQRVYKGDGKLSFICYSPYAFCLNKYIVGVADYYMLNPPETILCSLSNSEDNIFINSFELPAPANWPVEDIRYHYNRQPSDYEGGIEDETKYRDEPHQNKKGRQWDPNDLVFWHGGYPTIEQVQNGELYYDTIDGQKNIIEFRNYWDNIPEWQCAAKLLTTPTLDYDQELMYLPQYSKVDYINMELGFQNTRPMIGSRLLVYNPGDLPIDWELQIKINKKGFWSDRGGKFRVRRFNVERLQIPQAVDWCKLKTQNVDDDVPYKYGNKYFKRKIFDKNKLRKNADDEINSWMSFPEGWYENNAIPASKKWKEGTYNSETYLVKTNDPTFISNRNNEDWFESFQIAYNLFLDGELPLIQDTVQYEELKNAHPKHCYYIEPIPRDQLGHYIKLFFWQTAQIDDNQDLFEKGIFYSNLYEEQFKNCISKEEEYELYWKWLQWLMKQFDWSQNGEDLYYQYVNNPLEFIGISDVDASYGEDILNAHTYPSWITNDYLEIDAQQMSNINLIKQYMAAINSDEKTLFIGELIKYEPEQINKPQYRNLKKKLDKLLAPHQYLNDLLEDRIYLNSESRMLFANDNPVGNNYHYKPAKNIMNQAITKGTWFKLPPGWSLISIEPVVDETLTDGKRWLEARPFDWGYSGDKKGHKREASQLYDYIYEEAKKEFIKNEYIPINPEYPDITDDYYFKFRNWYEYEISHAATELEKQYYYKKRQIKEYQFLNIINDYWQLISPYYTWMLQKGVYYNPSNNNNFTKKEKDIEFDANGQLKRAINGCISDWWWYACNYLWINFPPLYWAAADCFNDIKIKYTPLFY